MCVPLHLTLKSQAAIAAGWYAHQRAQPRLAKIDMVLFTLTIAFHYNYVCLLLLVFLLPSKSVGAVKH